MGRLDAQDEAAIAALFASEYPRLVQLASLITGDDGLGRELAQEAFARLILRWRKLRTYDRPDAWLRLVVVRAALRTRDRRVRVEVLLPDAAAVADRSSGDARAAASSSTARAPDGVGEDDALVRALLALPRAQRAAVVLHYLIDLPIAEVAEHLGVTTGTVKTHLSRGRARLATLLTEGAADAP